MYCKTCGHDLPEGAKFCSNCGTRVEIVESKVNDEFVPAFLRTPKDDVSQPAEPNQGVAQSEMPKQSPAAPVMSFEPEEVKPEAELEAPKKVFQREEFNWNLDGYPDGTTKKTDAVDFNWESVVNERDKEIAQETYGIDMGVSRKKPESIEEPAAAEVDNGKTLEEELFGNEPERSTGFDKTIRVNSYEDIGRTQKIDKFYTYNRKKEEFQELLDKEYNRLKDHVEGTAPMVEPEESRIGSDIQVPEGAATLAGKPAFVDIPAAAEVAPVVEEPAPVVEDIPKAEEPAPVVEDVPKVEEPAPAVEEPKVETFSPFAEEPAPAVEKPAPAVEEPKVETFSPFEEEAAPAVEEPAPAVEEPAPAVEEPVEKAHTEKSGFGPMAGLASLFGRKSEPEEPAPAVEEVAPAVEDIPQVEEAVPVIEDIPQVEEAAPVIEDIPQVEEAAPAVEEAAPAVEEAAPAASDIPQFSPWIAEEKETPAPEEPSQFSPWITEKEEEPAPAVTDDALKMPWEVETPAAPEAEEAPAVTPIVEEAPVAAPTTEEAPVAAPTTEEAPVVEPEVVDVVMPDTPEEIEVFSEPEVEEEPAPAEEPAKSWGYEPPESDYVRNETVDSESSNAAEYYEGFVAPVQDEQQGEEVSEEPPFAAEVETQDEDYKTIFERGEEQEKPSWEGLQEEEPAIEEGEEAPVVEPIEEAPVVEPIEEAPVVEPIEEVPAVSPAAEEPVAEKAAEEPFKMPEYDPKAQKRSAEYERKPLFDDDVDEKGLPSFARLDEIRPGADEPQKSEFKAESPQAPLAAAEGAAEAADDKLTFNQVFEEEEAERKAKPVKKHTGLKVILVLLLILIVLEIFVIAVKYFAPDSAIGIQVQEIYNMIFSRFGS